MKTLVAASAAILIVAAIVGCAEYRAVIGERGAQAADDALEVSQWGHCKAATAASLERKYQLYSNPNGPLAVAWRELCYNSDEVINDE